MKMIIRLPTLRFWLLLVIFGCVMSPKVMAAQTIVTLTFDDGYSDAQTNGVPVLDASGFKGTFYIIDSDIGTPNYLTRAQLTSMQTDGQEIAGHTVDHTDLTTLTEAQQVAEICNDRSTLISWGFSPVSFAYPFGDYNASAEAVVQACGYTNARIVGGLDCNPANGDSTSCETDYANTPVPPTGSAAFLVSTPDSIISSTSPVDSILSTTSIANVEQYVTNAENNGGGWVPIVFHHVCNDGDTACIVSSGGPPYYATSTSTLAGILSYLQTQAGAGVVVETMAQAMGANITTPIPEITSLSSTGTAAGSPAFTLTVTGLNFTASSSILWNGVAASTVSTTFVNSTTLTTQIPASSLAAVSVDSITVSNPGVGTISPFVNFTVGNPVPVLTAITPVSARVGAPFTLTVVGNNFVKTSSIRWNGSTLTTTFVSSTTLKASVPTTDLAATGTASVTVFSPTPNGGTSAPETLVIYPTVGQTCPCQIFPNTTVPAPTDANGEATSLELGVKFKADVNGTITALRFYKLATSTGTHIGDLWLETGPGTGSLLASATYTGDPAASGWQTIPLSAPVAVTANTTYVASYFTSSGYAISDNYFIAGEDNAPLHALANNIDSNGVFVSGPAGTFPTSTSLSRNYWADVIFDNTVPTLIALAPSSTVVGSSTFTLIVTGTNFVSSTTVQWNGANKATTFVNSTTLNAVIPSTDVAQVKVATVTVFDAGLGGSTSNGLPFTVGYPVPTLISLSTTSVLVGSSSFTLTLTGTNFISSSTIQWNGSSRTTTFVSSTTLRTIVPASDLALAGNVAVTVVNPAPGGGSSNSLNFAVGNPIPTLITITPSFGTSGSSAISLTVTGTNFISSSTVQWNGSNISTTYVSSITLTAVIPAGDLMSVGIDTITVSNPAPAGGASNGKLFTITQGSGGASSVPTLTGLSPSSVPAGVPSFTLTLLGSSFTSGSTVLWDGSALATTFVNATTLTATVPATDVASAGTATLSVMTTGGTSGSQTFTIGGSHPRVFPNPWKVTLHGRQPITFDGMTYGSTIKIFTTSARWVRTLSAPAGVATWDLKNDSGDAVASGYYIYLITDSTSDKVRGIIGIIR